MYCPKCGAQLLQAGTCYACATVNWAAPSGNAAGDGQLDPLDGRMRYKHNPAHACGTCGDCGNEMVWNVPRLGAAGGFIHKATGKFECNSPIGGSELPAPLK